MNNNISNYKKKRKKIKPTHQCCKICETECKQYQKPSVKCTKCQQLFHINCTVTWNLLFRIEPYKPRDREYNISQNFICCFCCDDWTPILNVNISKWTHFKCKIYDNMIRIHYKNINNTYTKTSDISRRVNAYVDLGIWKPNIIGNIILVQQVVF
eukprot:462576_1